MSARSVAASRRAASKAGLHGFLAWWRNGLLAWLPARLRHTLEADKERLLLQVQGDLLALRFQRDGGITDLASLPLPAAGAADPLRDVLRDNAGKVPRWLLMPASQGLRRTLVLPAAARERLREVLGFEIERQTPFAAADALYDGRVLGVREDGQLQVELVVVPRRQVDATRTQLGALAAGLAGIDLADAEGRTLGVNLLPAGERAIRSNPWRGWNLGLAVLAVLALALGMNRVVENRRAAADQLQGEVSKRGQQARGVAEQRQQVLDDVQGGAWLRAQRNGTPPMLEILDALAQRIPDGTYLEKLAIEGRQLTLIGLSSQAAALVGEMEGAPQWQAPALGGALQQDPRTRMDRFTVSAQLAGAPADAAGARNGRR